MFHSVSLQHHYRAGPVLYRASCDISDVAFASVYSEKTRLKNCLIMIIIIITEKPFTVNEKGDIHCKNSGVLFPPNEQHTIGVISHQPLIVCLAHLSWCARS